MVGLKNGVLLEAGFDDISPNEPKDISSWAYDFSARAIDLIDNRPKAVACYDPGYTLVEKLQTISTKFRKQQDSGEFPVNFMRHYYDIYCLLKRPEVQAFIGTPAYRAHKQKRFPKADNQNIAENAAFVLSDPKTRKICAKAYIDSTALYYNENTIHQSSMTEENGHVFNHAWYHEACHV